jgi:hypothetical protein
VTNNGGDRGQHTGARHLSGEAQKRLNVMARARLQGGACSVSTPDTDQRLSNSMVLDLKATAEYLGISKAHLSNVINRKVLGVPPLRCARIGRRILIKREWADEWLESVGQESRFTNGSI